MGVYYIDSDEISFISLPSAAMIRLDGVELE
jgi:hypothetical protein